MTPRYSKNNIEKYKVFVPKANGSCAIGEVISTPLIGTPLTSATPTFISIGHNLWTKNLHRKWYEIH